jgi:superfamily II DNA or RNA helicase
MKYYEHQREIIDQDPKKTGLWLGCGSGKTRIALALAKGKTLVICKKTQREDKNWEKEVEKMGINLDLTVISKEDFRRDAEKLPKFDTIIGDEAHSLLGVTPQMKWVKREQVPSTSQLFEKLRWYVNHHKPERIYLATATIVKSPFTVWAAGVILKGWPMDTYYKFRSIYYIKLPMPGREVYAPRKEKKIKDRLAQVVRNLGPVGRLEDYYDVPEQTFKNEYVELTTDQKKRLSTIELDFTDPLVAAGKIHQIENGVLTGDEYNCPEVFKNNKTERLVEYAYEFPRMVVFIKYTMQIEETKKALEKEGFKVYVMNGKTKDRGELLNELKGSQEYILLVQASISEGWELPECPVMIFMSRTFSLVDYTQGIGRILRSNNLKKNLYINLITKGGVDERVDDSLNNKQDFDAALYIEQNFININK